MRMVCATIFLLVALVSPVAVASAAAQSTASGAPTLIPISGALQTPTGEPRTGSVLLVLSLYDGRDDPAPRWVEHQVVTLDAAGQYDVQFGSTLAEGLPADLFSGTLAVRWAGVAVENEPEQPRMMLVAVPYASNATSADTLAGKPASDFVLTADLTDQVKAVLQEARSGGGDSVGTNDVTLNFLQKGDALGTTTDSTVSEVGGNVGVGTTSPTRTLSVRRSGSGNAEIFDFLQPSTSSGNVVYGLIGRSAAAGEAAIFGHQYNSTISDSIMWMANYGDNHATSGLIIRKGGNVGIGTTSPTRPLSVRRTGSGHLEIFDFLQPATASGNVVYGLIGRSAVPGEAAIFGHQYSSTISDSLMWMANYGDNHATSGLIIRKGGNVGIGTTSPTAKLHVNGNTTVIGNATITGNVTVDGNIAAKYQDVAEWVDSVEPLEPGTVVVIDAAGHNRVKAASSSYDSRVAGAVSPQPGLILGEPGEGKVLVAQSGRVRIKVDARYGAIKAGDLLVSSPRKGYAMRSKPVRVGGASMHRPGTVLGKALEPLASGAGEILVLLTLQ